MKNVKYIVIILLIFQLEHISYASMRLTIKQDTLSFGSLTHEEDKLKELQKSHEDLIIEIKEIEKELIVSKENSSTIQRLEVQLQEKKIALSEVVYLLNKHKELEAEKAENRRITRINIFLVILLSVILLLLFVTILFFREKLSRKTLLNELNRMKQIAFSRQLNPHFIHNSLGSIQNYVFNESKLEANRYITLFSQLIRQIFENSKNELITIRQEAEALESYLNLESMRFSNKFTFSITIDKTIFENKMPPSLLQPVIENSIWHGLMHKDGNGFVKVSIQKLSEKQVKCIIEDNGIGRKKSAEINKHKQVLKKSSGLELTSKRLEILNKLNKKNYSSMEIVDLEDEKANAIGTKTEINIPLL